MQGLELPSPGMTVAKTPDARQKPTCLPSGEADPFVFHEPPSTIGMAKLKRRTKKPTSTPRPLEPTPILPSPALGGNAGITFQFAPSSSSATVQIPSSSVPYSTQQYRKRKQQQEDLGNRKRKYVRTATTVKCGKCGEDRIPPTHQQYMGYRYCQTKDAIPFAVWRDNLQRAGVARKKNL
jgi:hypothetical protein